MRYRSRKVEKCVLDFYNILPLNLRQFTFDIKRAVLTLKNCVVLSYREFAERSNRSFREVIAYCKSYTGCVLKEEGSDNYIIMYNDYPNISREGQAFILAHELSHIMLGHMRVLESFKIYNSNHPNEHFEREANYFAACLLCPYPVLSRLRPKSTLSIKGIFGLTDKTAEISFENYKNYDKDYHIQWHNEILKLFDFQCDLLRFYTYKLDCACEASEEIAPKINYEKDKSISIPRSTWERGDPIKKTERCEVTFSSSFEKLEDDWLYPEALGL